MRLNDIIVQIFNDNVLQHTTQREYALLEGLAVFNKQELFEEAVAVITLRIQKRSPSPDVLKEE